MPYARWSTARQAAEHAASIIRVLTLYQDWLPFGLALGYVVHHTVLGLVTPTDVFNHPAALRPLEVGADPRGFVLAASVASLVTWRLSEHQAIDINRLVSRLEGLARTDPLPGVPNRRVWEELPRELERARRTGAEVCLAMVDLDDFKAYNDRFGHQAGDLVLKEAATAWRGEVRSTDLLARYGGEEFVLLLPACALDDAIRIVERLRVVTPWSRARSGWPAGISRRGAELIQRADQAPVHGQGRGPQPPRPGLLIRTTPEPDPPLAGPRWGSVAESVNWGFGAVHTPTG